jgi:hypothetical protein
LAGVRLVTLWLVALAACNDLRDFEGEWSGPRVGDSPVLRVGVAGSAEATLAIDGIDKHGLRGRLTIDGLATDAPFSSLEGAEADALATMSFTGTPMRVYLAFVPASGGDALAMIALYDSRRIEVRVLRGEPAPVYAIFALSEAGR